MPHVTRQLCAYLTTLLSAPSGVTSEIGAKAYAAKLVIRPETVHSVAGHGTVP